MKYFIVADVHGFYDEMLETLDRAGFDPDNPNHTFVSLGDMFDRGQQAKEMLDFLVSLPEDRRIFIMGNHELLMNEAIGRRFFLYHDSTNGTKSTAYQLSDAHTDDDACIYMQDDWAWNKYFNSCVFYAEVGDNIFVHGWIPCDIYPTYYRERYIYNPGWRDAPIYEWKEATWRNGMEAWHMGVREPDKTIWCGHWHSGYGHANIHGICHTEVGGKDSVYTPFRDEGIVAMDACTIVSHIVNCEVIEVNSGQQGGY